MPDGTTEKGDAAAAANTETAEAAKPPKRIPRDSLKLQFAGELVLVRCPDRALAGLFRRYEALFEHFANMERSERIINYKFLCGLILTSHAKKAESTGMKKHLFDLKNELYLQLANDRETRRKLAFRYLASPHFRVTEFCDECKKRNEEEGNKPHNWKFCKKCKIDRNFYDILSMHHKFDRGSATLFLSHDQMHKVENLKLKRKGKLDDAKEEAVFDKYHYNVKNLDAFERESVLQWQKKLTS